MNDHRFYVYIVESPSADDLFNNALEGRTLTEALRVSGIDYNYLVTANFNTFNIALGQNLESTLFHDGHKRSPIIHISAHGSPDGIAFTNGESITWESLYQRLADLNQRFSGGLIVSVSTCFGAFAERLLMPNRPAPFFALVGPTTSIELSDLAIGFSSFYHNIKKYWDINIAFNAMKTASGNQNFNLKFSQPMPLNYQQVMKTYW